MSNRTRCYVRQMTGGIFAFFLFAACALSEDETLQSLGIDQVHAAQPFQILYSAEDVVFIEETAAVLSKSLEEYATHLPAGDEPITIIICPDYRAFVRLAGVYGRPSITGIARSEEGLIVIKSPRDLVEPMAYQDTLRHEVIHVLLARNVNIAELPRWLNEGIAMVLAKEHRWSSSLRVGQLYMRGQILGYRDLRWAMESPRSEGQFSDAYAQSLAMTRYLMERMGDEDFWRMLHALDTQTFVEAMRTHTGLTPAELSQEWQASLWKLALVFSLVSGFSIFQLMALLTIVAYIRKKRKARRVLRQWEAQEAAEEKDEPLPLWELFETDGEEWRN